MKTLLTLLLSAFIASAVLAQDEFKAGDCVLNVPNAISKPKDGSSDSFSVSSDCEFPEFQLVIFNRWGSKVLVVNELNKTADISKLTEGVHVWNMKLTDESGEQYNFVGNLTVLN